MSYVDVVKSSLNDKVLTVVRLLIAVACVVLVLRFANATEIAKTIMALSFPALIFVVVLHAIIILALAWRWAILVRGMGPGVSYAFAARVTFASTLLNMILPTSVGGDVGRVWFGKKHGVALVPGSAAAVLDRGLGLASLLFVIFIGGFWLGDLTAIVVLFASLTTGMLGLALLLRWAGRLPEQHVGYRTIEAIRTITRNRYLLIQAFGLSFASHIAAALIAAAIADGMGLPLSLLNAVVLFPIVLLTTAIPVSIGGWGLRELAAIPVLALAGIGAEGATAIAFVFGLTQVATALAGTLIVNFPMLWRAPA